MNVHMKPADRELTGQISRGWKLSVPASLTQITTIAMQYIDSAMVGNLGANASAAIGTGLAALVVSLVMLWHMGRSKYLKAPSE